MFRKRTRNELLAGSLAHVVIVIGDYDGRQMSFYVDGELDFRSQLDYRRYDLPKEQRDSFLPSEGPLYLGRSPWNGWTSFVLQDLRRYDGALSADHVRDLYANRPPAISSAQLSTYAVEHRAAGNCDHVLDWSGAEERSIFAEASRIAPEAIATEVIPVIEDEAANNGAGIMTSTALAVVVTSALAAEANQGEKSVPSFAQIACDEKEVQPAVTAIEVDGFSTDQKVTNEECEHVLQTGIVTAGSDHEPDLYLCYAQGVAVLYYHSTGRVLVQWRLRSRHMIESDDSASMIPPPIKIPSFVFI